MAMRYVVSDDPAAQLVQAIVLSGKKFAVRDYWPWIGNWCWDRVLIRGKDVLHLLNWSRFRSFFDLNEAEVRLFNWWRSGREWIDADLRLIGKRFDRG